MRSTTILILLLPALLTRPRENTAAPATRPHQPNAISVNIPKTAVPRSQPGPIPIPRPKTAILQSPVDQPTPKAPLNLSLYQSPVAVQPPNDPPVALYSQSDSRQPSPIDWSKTSDWKLYSIHSKKAYAWPADTLSHFPSVPLNQDTIIQYLKNSSKIPIARTPVWMGFYIATCRLPDNTLIKLELSQYGRFFYSEKDNTFYQLGEEVQADWQPYLTAKLKTLEAASN